jgi:hypothetical protein
VCPPGPTLYRLPCEASPPRRPSSAARSGSLAKLPPGSVTVSRNSRTTFKGRLSLKGKKAYMCVDSTVTTNEQLFVVLDARNDPRGDPRPSICIWLGNSGEQTTTAGHGLLSRTKLDNPSIIKQCVLAEVRWRWTLKVFCVAACTERNLCADPTLLRDELVGDKAIFLHQTYRHILKLLRKSLLLRHRVHLSS